MLLVFLLCAVSAWASDDGLPPTRLSTTDTWVVHVRGGREVAQLLAVQHHYAYLGKVEGFEDHYRLVKRGHSKHAKLAREGHRLSRLLVDHPMVVWAEQQVARRRAKRGYVPSSPRRGAGGDDGASSPTGGGGRREEDDEEDEEEEEDDNEDNEDEGDMESGGARGARGIFSYFFSRYSFIFNDTLWTKQWYLQDYRTDGGVPVLDLNVVPCYARGITGKGVRIAILDDGLEWTHPDLRDNYDPSISADFVEGDRDPMPRYAKGEGAGGNAHGTRCAGEIAMKANNSFCGVGVSYDARVGGIKILDGTTTDVVEGSALLFALDLVDVYSNSWGPPDDGRTVEAPGKMACQAFETGTSQGRGGLGAIYVFAAGNGKESGDGCWADGYIQSVQTVAVASATQQGLPPFYGERCAAILTTAYSSGGRADEKIATTDIRGRCTTKHSGTSAAAPLAAGIIALALQANPRLTWRCVQHLLAWTSEVAVLGDDAEWLQNGAGFWANPNFGFGLINAYNMARAAAAFRPVPPKAVCNVTRHNSESTYRFSPNASAVISLTTDGCAGRSEEINFLEHVQVVVSLSYGFRGAVAITLKSPSGMVTPLMERRERDNSTAGLRAWTLTSVHNWGERPDGVWTLNVTAQEVADCPWDEGEVTLAHMLFHGTEEMPDHYRNGRRRYSTYRFSRRRAHGRGPGTATNHHSRY